MVLNLTPGRLLRSLKSMRRQKGFVLPTPSGSSLRQFDIPLAREHRKVRLPLGASILDQEMQDFGIWLANV